jgi:hypothetical protein
MPDFLEAHYTVRQIAAAWGLSASTVRRIFSQVPGVLKIGSTRRKGVGRHVTLAIPERVVRAQYALLTKSALHDRR